MAKALLAPALLILLILTACSDPASTPVVEPTAAPQQQATTPVASWLEPTQPAEPTATLAPQPTETPTANENVPTEIEAAARRFLAGELEVDEGDLRLDSSESVQWSDASLGCPQEGMLYAQVITPGHRLVFGHAGTSHAVHTNSDGSHMVVCGGGR